jgi:hypothetical protein
MIYELTRDLTELLRAKKYPAPIVYGPERLTRGQPVESSIIIERDRGMSDVIGPVKATEHARPRSSTPATVAPRILTRHMAVAATFYIQSTLESARVNEHEAECEAYVDAFLVALHTWCTVGLSGYEVAEARYLAASEVDKDHAPEAWAGVVYVLRFRLARGVYVLDYTGAARSTGTVQHVSNTADIRRTAGDPDAPPETVEM